ncbi:hypothetical protein GN244_ATG05400 [Phytophthora infestans]|uniref:Uncharacterized protein n=1 Tax=Phytophthora infestans TaxID=4787 RepID=A0A833SYU1_PHYIN|nr:hypothetical protein GN244_ATG05400 [Phytophthora infestans]KAF4137172.1 hypothetical protein GN958_ATG13640 [Phytophthora infestans]
MQQGISRFMSLAYSASSAIEIGGPLATAILMEGGAGKFSCKFERLALVEGLHMMANQDIELSVVRQGDHLVTQSSIRHYITRPKCLDKYCWYDFCAWFKPSTSKFAVPGDTCTFASNNPDVVASHERLHGLSRVEYPNVPDIIGPRLPDARLLEDVEHGDQAELYYRATALFYCPLRHSRDFLDDEGSVRQLFCSGTQMHSQRSNAHLISISNTILHWMKLASSERQAAESEHNICTDPDVLDGRIDRDSSAAAARGENLFAVASDLYACAANPTNLTDEEAAVLENAADDSVVQR